MLFEYDGCTFLARITLTPPRGANLLSKFTLFRTLIAIGLFLTGTSVVLFSQTPRGGGPAGGQPNVNDAYVGILSSQGAEAGLFHIKSTGVSTDPIRKSAEAFLAGLTEEQRGRTVYPVDDSEWRKWDNRHSPKRQGVGFNEMSEAQRKLAFEMLTQSLSAKGLKKTQDIMKLNGKLAELANNFQEYGE